MTNMPPTGNLPPKFRIEQVALKPEDSAMARMLLQDLGLTDWVSDTVTAQGQVFGENSENTAFLQFNYQSDCGDKPLELELLEYNAGENWMDVRACMNGGDEYVASHLGMHCTEEELAEYRAYFDSKGIAVAQEVNTTSHTNPAIATSRRYLYVIFDTRNILGIDLKFIVRKPYPA